jgi:hypothetical protein
MGTMSLVETPPICEPLTEPRPRERPIALTRKCRVCTMAADEHRATGLP